jgi:hypothetical protein
MRSIRLWRWYIDVPVTILDAIHRSEEWVMNIFQNFDSCNENNDFLAGGEFPSFDSCQVTEYLNRYLLIGFLSFCNERLERNLSKARHWQPLTHAKTDIVLK